MDQSTLPQQVLAEYASGRSSPAVSLMVASHLTHSPGARARVAALEAVGGALMADEVPAAMEDEALRNALTRLDEPECAPAGDGIASDAGPLPRPLAEAVGMPFDRIPWKFRLPGIAEYTLEGFGEDHVSLLRAKPGARIPQHTHEGTEMTLVLAGSLEDGGRVYGPGDVTVNTDDDDHKPVIRGDEICYCLIVMEGRMRFTGTFSRMLNVF